MSLSKQKFAIVVSEYNTEVTDKLLEGALLRFAELNISHEQLTVEKVPGAIEIPLVAKLLAKSNQYRAIVCLGAVIRGETGHYDFVCQQVSDGCLEVMLAYEIPVIFGVLTTNNLAQALARVGGEVGHKGVEAVDAAMAMVKVVDRCLII